jgi:hypothetical protein
MQPMQVEEARPRPMHRPRPAAAVPPRPVVSRDVRGPAPWLTATLAAAAGAALLLAAFGRATWGAPGADVAGLAAGGIVLVAGALGAVVTLAVRRGLRARAVASSLARAWSGDLPWWASTGIGVVVALPFLATTASVVSDADSSRIIAYVDHVLTFGPGYLVDSQEVFLPIVLLGPALALGGIAGARLFTILFLAALCGAVSFLGWRLNRSLVAAVAAPLALVCLHVITYQSTRLPMYLPMLALGYVGGWCASRAIDDPGRARWRWAIAAALALVLSSEAHAVGQLFLGVPLLVFLIGLPWPSRRALPGVVDRFRGLLAVGIATALAMLPRLAVNLAEGGLSRLRSNRTDYWVGEGYLDLINREFWDHPATRRLDYLEQIPDAMAKAIGPYGIAAAALGVIAFLLARGRARWLGVLCTALMVGALLQRIPPPFPRYFAPLLPGLALAAAAAPALVSRRLGRAAGRVVAAVALVALVAAAGTSWVRTVERAATAEESVAAGPLPGMVERIDDGRGVIGARVGRLLYADRGTPVWGTLFLTEDEFATYLTWPSDDEVIEVFEGRDIGWALVSTDTKREVDYHDTWLVPAHGGPARHVESLAASPAFCAVDRNEGYVLYRLGPCRPGDAEAAG